MSDEPLLGWLVRASEKQGYWNIRLIEELAGVPLALMEADDLTARVAEILHCDVDEVRRRARHQVFIRGTSYRNAQARVRYFDHELSQQHLASRPRVCPICLQESAYVRGVWYLNLYRACENHRVWLIDHCNGCNEPLKHERHSVSRCRCGESLSHAEARSAPTLAALVSQFISAGFSRRAEIEPVQHGMLQSLELNSRLDLIAALMIGRTTPRSETLEGSLARWQLSSPSDLGDAINHAGALLQGWPQALEAELAETMEALPKGASLLRHGGPALSAWIGWDFPKELEFLDEIVERTVRNRWARYLQDRAKHEEVALCEPSRRNTDPGQIKSKGYPGSAVNTPYDPIEAIPVGDAAAILGIDIRTIIQLFPTWHLSRTRGFNGRPTSPRVVLGADVFGLRALLSGMNEPWVDDPTSQYITFEEASHACSLLDVHVSRLVQVLLSGAVRICEPRRSVFRLQDTLINDTEFSLWLWQAVCSAPSRSVRVDVARQLLKVNAQTFERLIFEGLLSIDPKRDEPDPRRVPLEAIFELLGRIRIMKRVEEFCGIRGEPLSKRMAEEGAKMLPLPPHRHGQARQLRIALVEELESPGVRLALREAAHRKWYPGSTAP